MPLTDQDILDRVEGQTVPTAFMATVAEHGDLVALRWMDGEDWKQLTLPLASALFRQQWRTWRNASGRAGPTSPR